MRLTRRRALAAVIGLGLLAGCTDGDQTEMPSEETESPPTETAASSPSSTATPTPTPTPTASPTPTSESPGSTTEPASGDASGSLVVMEGVAFSPMRLSVEPGTTVAWENGEALQHNVRAATFDDAGDRLVVSV